MSQALSAKTVMAISCFTFLNTFVMEISQVFLQICHTNSGEESQTVGPSLELFIIQRSSEGCTVSSGLKSRARNRGMNCKVGIKLGCLWWGGGRRRGGMKPQTWKPQQKYYSTHTVKTHSDTEFSTCSTWIFNMHVVVKCVASGLVTGSCELCTHKCMNTHTHT